MKKSMCYAYDYAFFLYFACRYSNEYKPLKYSKLFKYFINFCGFLL